MNHGKKMIAPIIVSIIVIVWLLGNVIFYLLMNNVNTPSKIIYIVISIILSGVMLGVLISRIREIKGGEEDDLSKY
ncbi:hypothetical protein [Peptostreptococcus canis]|uniref:Uncharacterized protein n=1 Tax=Peptostreptococcus canis TaxID=1159213 RepID=A0ABR6TJG4_9FIRM|nr:hypothetical protein [Peptostreptococcus canis]MBC2575283.1 hypothetical protein [Peptostreptococcus canis]MBP1997534.1 putative membrane protein [Peptostreptococcus canis]